MLYGLSSRCCELVAQGRLHQYLSPKPWFDDSRYHHFSIYVNGDRRLPAVTACNIESARSAAVNRSNKPVNLTVTLEDLGVEALGTESSDDLRPDVRFA